MDGSVVWAVLAAPHAGAGVGQGSPGLTINRRLSRCRFGRSGVAVPRVKGTGWLWPPAGTVILPWQLEEVRKDQIFLGEQPTLVIGPAALSTVQQLYQPWGKRRTCTSATPWRSCTHGTSHPSPVQKGSLSPQPMFCPSAEDLGHVSSHLPGRMCGGSGCWKLMTVAWRRLFPMVCQALLLSGFPPAGSSHASAQGQVSRAFPAPASSQGPQWGTPSPQALLQWDLRLTPLWRGEGAAAASALSVTRMSATQRRAMLCAHLGSRSYSQQKAAEGAGDTSGGSDMAYGSDSAWEGTADITCWHFQDEFLCSHCANQLLHVQGCLLTLLQWGTPMSYMARSKSGRVEGL